MQKIKSGALIVCFLLLCFAVYLVFFSGIVALNHRGIESDMAIVNSTGSGGSFSSNDGLNIFGLLGASLSHPDIADTESSGGGGGGFR